MCVLSMCVCVCVCVCDLAQWQVMHLPMATGLHQKRTSEGSG